MPHSAAVPPSRPTRRRAGAVKMQPPTGGTILTAPSTGTSSKSEGRRHQHNTHSTQDQQTYLHRKLDNLSPRPTPVMSSGSWPPSTGSRRSCGCKATWIQLRYAAPEPSASWPNPRWRCSCCGSSAPNSIQQRNRSSPGSRSTMRPTRPTTSPAADQPRICWIPQRGRTTHRASRQSSPLAVWRSSWWSSRLGRLVVG